jgi:hypothetical protein
MLEFFLMWSIFVAAATLFALLPVVIINAFEAKTPE